MNLHLKRYTDCCEGGGAEVMQVGPVEHPRGIHLLVVSESLNEMFVIGKMKSEIGSNYGEYHE